MDVVDRYLQNVRSYLPGSAQDDFVAELRENIRAQVEDREERLGRPLTEDDLLGLQERARELLAEATRKTAASDAPTAPPSSPASSSSSAMRRS